MTQPKPIDGPPKLLFGVELFMDGQIAVRGGPKATPERLAFSLRAIADSIEAGTTVLTQMDD